MDDLVESMANGNVTEVKVVLASVVAALAVYQVLLMLVGYGKVKVPFLDPKPASFAHRTVGDAIVVLTLTVAFMCVGYFEFEDGIEHAGAGETGRVAFHVIVGSLLVAALVLKVIVVRWWHSAGRFLPLIGSTVFLLFALTWATSAYDYLFGG